MNHLPFNDLPQVVAQLRDEVSGMKALLLNLQNRPTQQRENRHRPITPEQVAKYTNIPLATIYQKLANKEIPGTKPGKRWVIFLDEIDKWLEANRKNPIPLTDEEQNNVILSSHRRKPKKADWRDETLVQQSQGSEQQSQGLTPCESQDLARLSEGEDLARLPEGESQPDCETPKEQQQ